MGPLPTSCSARSRGRRRSGLFLRRFLADEADKVLYRTKSRDEAHSILKHWADLEQKGYLVKKETALDNGFLEKVFGDALGYRSHPENPEDYQLEVKFSVPGVGTADAALGNFRHGAALSPLVVMELKDSGVNLDRDRFNGRTAGAAVLGLSQRPARLPLGDRQQLRHVPPVPQEPRDRRPTRSSPSRNFAARSGSRSSTASSSAAGWCTPGRAGRCGRWSCSSAPKTANARSATSCTTNTARSGGGLIEHLTLQTRDTTWKRRSTSPSESSTASSSSPSAKTATCCSEKTISRPYQHGAAVRQGDQSPLAEFPGIVPRHGPGAQEHALPGSRLQRRAVQGRSPRSTTSNWTTIGPSSSSASATTTSATK